MALCYCISLGTGKMDVAKCMTCLLFLTDPLIGVITHHESNLLMTRMSFTDIYRAF